MDLLPILSSGLANVALPVVRFVTHWWPQCADHPGPGHGVALRDVLRARVSRAHRTDVGQGTGTIFVPTGTARPWVVVVKRNWKVRFALPEPVLSIEIS